MKNGMMCIKIVFKRYKLVVKLAKKDLLTRVKTIEEQQKDLELLKLIPELQSRIRFLEELIEDRMGYYIPRRMT